MSGGKCCSKAQTYLQGLDVTTLKVRKRKNLSEITAIVIFNVTQWLEHWREVLQLLFSPTDQTKMQVEDKLMSFTPFILMLESDKHQVISQITMMHFVFGLFSLPLVRLHLTLELIWSSQWVKNIHHPSTSLWFQLRTSNLTELHLKVLSFWRLCKTLFTFQRQIMDS